MSRSEGSTGSVPLVQEGPVRWRIDRHGAMRVPGVVFASSRLLPNVLADRSLFQVVNVATLPGIVDASYAMPDIHWGYGFPIGGVAATDVEHGGSSLPAAWGSTSPAGSGCLHHPSIMVSWRPPYRRSWTSWIGGSPGIGRWRHRGAWMTPRWRGS